MASHTPVASTSAVPAGADNCTDCLKACPDCPPPPTFACCPPVSAPALPGSSTFATASSPGSSGLPSSLYGAWNAAAMCLDCAMESDRAGGGAGPAGQSHLAWCCDAEECLSPVAESQSSLGGTTMNVAAGDGVPWDQMLLLDSAQPSSTSASVSDADCLQCASIPMIDTCCAPSAIHAGCIDPTCVPPAALARADCPTCVDGLGLITIDGDGGHVATLEEKGKGVARRKDGDEQIPDLDSLLQGLDEQTIQDILNCCCCDTVLHDQPSTFDPSSHLQHQQLPQHIHCAEPHQLSAPHSHTHPPHLHPSPPALDPAAVLDRLSRTTFQPPTPASLPSTASPPTASAPFATPPAPFNCGWRDCTLSFVSHDELTMHVLGTHLIDPTGSAAPTAASSNWARAALLQVVQQAQAAGQGGLSDPLAAALLSLLATALPASTATSGPRVHSSTHSALPRLHTHARAHPPHAHVHRHPRSHAPHRHPYGAAHAHAVAAKREKQQKSQVDETLRATPHSVGISPPPSIAVTASREASVSVAPISPHSEGRDGASTPASSPLASTSASSPPVHEHACRWRHCTLTFPTTSLLMEHLSTAHVGAGKARYTCEWDGCERSTCIAAFEEGEDSESLGNEEWEKRREEREDKGLFRQRQKVMRHLQMHTGDRPFACEVCGKTFSESLTLAQHMRVHTQERPYVCDHPGCGKSFSLASGLTIHKRTHSGDRPFVCPHPGCTAAFAESSNLSKHVRTHGSERRYVCSEPGCDKSFGRSDQLKRHAKVHERRKRGAKDEKEDEGVD